MSDSSMRWDRVHSLLDAALDLPPDDRIGYLDRTCSGEPALRAEVGELLEACESASGYLETPVTDDAALLLAVLSRTTDGLAIGTRIGPYRIAREAGRGGMGVVYVADRDDGEFTMRVAVKVLMHGPGMQGASLRRFREERQILATLDHAGIARIVDGGVTADGAPWFAMECVDGVPIDRYCHAHALDIAQRVELFTRVCDAVQYAHDHGVIHRDIKPSNILVTADGAVKLLDFGIAKLASFGEHASYEDSTLPGFRPMTPDYASPEQLDGMSASRVSDVYALGVLLYVMLAGYHPWRRGGEGASALVRRIAAREKPQPLPAAVPPALDAIVGVAISSQPELRYPSVTALAGDLRAWRSGTALSPQVSTRVRRWRAAGPQAQKLIVAGGIAAVAVLLLTARTRQPEARAIDPLSAVVALPFAAAADDSALARFGRDLMVTLDEQLDGMGPVHTIGPGALLSRSGQAGGAPSTTRDLEDPRSLGAAAVLRGTLTRNGDRVLAVVALRALNDSVPIARASAVLAVDDVAASADSLRTQLLHDLWRSHGWVPNPAAVTTHSVPALRAYLAGERAVLENRMPAASSQFEHAIDADPTFWYACWRLAWAREFMGRAVDSELTARYQTHARELPDRDRLLIEARQITSLPDRLARSAHLARQFPGYWPALLDYADLVIHRGPYAGVSLSEARESLDRAVLLEPALAPAWDGRMIVALTDRDTTGSARALASLERLHYDSASRAIGGFEMLTYYRYLDHLSRTGGVADPAETERIATLLSGQARPEEGRFQGGMSRYGFHGARLDIGRYTLGMRGARKDHLAFEWGEAATTWASRGAWDSAIVAADRATTLMPTPERALFAYRLAAMGTALGELPPATALARRPGAVSGSATLPVARRIELAWVDGVLAAATHDGAALRRARQRLAGYAVPLASTVDSSLRARLLDLEGRRAEATTLLRALLVGRYGPGIGTIPYLGGMDRLLLSRWLRDAGRPQQAAPLLVWHEALVRDVQTSHANALLAAYAYLDRATLEEATGQREAAAADYRQFLRRYDRPSSSRRPMAAAARAAVSRLAGR